MLRRVLIIFVVVGILLSACDYVVHPNDPNTVNGVPAFAPIEGNPTLFGELYEQSVRCPLYEGNHKADLLARLQLSEDSDAVIRICKSYEQIQNSALMISSVLVLPAVLEPTVLGEATIGTVTAGGKLVGVITLYVGLGVAVAGSVLGDINDETLVPAITIPEIPTMGAGLWDPDHPEKIPESVINDIARENHHALLDHATATCVSDLAGRLTPHRVYYSYKAPNKGIYEPSVMFAWNADRMMKELAGNPGKCANLDKMLAREYADRSNPGRQVYLLLIMRQDNRGLQGLIAVTAYPILIELFGAHLCEWNYTLQLYPKVKPICGGPPI